jgi:hypothetical protein
MPQRKTTSTVQMLSCDSYHEAISLLERKFVADIMQQLSRNSYHIAAVPWHHAAAAIMQQLSFR